PEMRISARANYSHRRTETTRTITAHRALERVRPPPNSRGGGPAVLSPRSQCARLGRRRTAPRRRLSAGGPRARLGQVRGREPAEPLAGGRAGAGGGGAAAS